MSVPATNLISMISNVCHVQKVLYFLWLKKVVEHVRLVLSSIKTLIIVRRNHITQILKIRTGPVKKPTLKFRNNLNSYQRIRFMKSVQFKSPSQLEKNVCNAIMMSISTLTKRSVINATTVKHSIKTSTIVHTPKWTSKLILKNHQTWSLKAGQRMNGCTFTTKTLRRMMEWLIVHHKDLTLTG